MLQFSLFGPAVGNINADDENSHRTATPIKHVIIIIGENRTFDHIFATYKPNAGESVNNLLSEGIIKEDGTPGPHYSRAHQFSADVTGSPVFELSPTTKIALFSPPRATQRRADGRLQG
jgi:phospholipase C